MSSDDEREVEEDGIENIFASITHFHFDLFLNQIISITHPSIPPKIPLSLSLWMNTQTHTSLTHIYHTNQQQSMSSPSFKSLPNSSFSFSKTTHSSSLPLPKQSFLLSILKINFFLSSSHSSHLIQECD